MHINKKLLEKYNQPETLLVISSYPPKGTTYGRGVGGMASYTKNTLKGMSHYAEGSGKEFKVVVLAEILDAPQVYEEGNVLVVRCWKRASPLIFWQLGREIVRFSKAWNVLAEFEFAAYDGLVLTGLMPIFLMWLRLTGKRVNLVLHQVLYDLGQLSGHIGLETNSLSVRTLTPALKLFYWLLSLPTQKVITLERFLGERLSEVVSQNKIVVIPHGVDASLVAANRRMARKQLGLSQKEFVVLYFGFLTWYKGADLVAKAFAGRGNRRIKLLLAGGESPTQREKAHYQKFLRGIAALTQKSCRVIATGFVPEEKVKTYFAAADLVLFPYRVAMSSSGPLSLALSFNKPFLVSKPLLDVMDGDYAEKSKREKHALSLEPSKMFRTVDLLRKNRKSLARLTKLSITLAADRDFNQVGGRYFTEIMEPEKQVEPMGVVALVPSSK